MKKAGSPTLGKVKKCANIQLKKPGRTPLHYQNIVQIKLITDIRN